MKFVKKITFTFGFLLLSICSFAERPAPYDFRNSGKVFVVYTVIFIILFVIFIYLFSLDRKIKKLEDKENS